MDDWYRQRNVSHPFPADTFHGDFYATAITNYSFVSYTLIFTTMAFPITDRPKYFFTKKTILFGFERPIVYGFGLGNLSMRSFQNFIWRGEIY
jgi:hypothetical protein